MDPSIIKKTQDTLGKVIKKPPLTEKLLTKPPFRFLHDCITQVIKTTGVLKGLYQDGAMTSDNVTDKEAKLDFLQKALDTIVFASGDPLSARPSKIVAGHEPEKTNELLQALGRLCQKKVDTKEAVKKVLAGEKPSSKKSKDVDTDKKKDKSKEDKSKDEQKQKDDAAKKERTKDDRKEKERSRDKESKEKESKDKKDNKDREGRDKDKRSSRDKDKENKERDKDRDKEKRRETSKERTERKGKEGQDGRDKKDREKSKDEEGSKDKESRSKDKDASSEDRKKERKERDSSSGKERKHIESKDKEDRADKDKQRSRDRDRERERGEKRERSSKRRGDRHEEPAADEKISQNQNIVEDGDDALGNEANNNSRVQRPSSAKGQRRRPSKDIDDEGDDDDILGGEIIEEKTTSKTAIQSNFNQEMQEPRQQSAVRKPARPSSARPAPPKIKKALPVEEEQSRVVSGKATAPVIMGTSKADEDEDDTFIVEESDSLINLGNQIQQQESDPNLINTQEHGSLVRKMLESKKEAENTQKPSDKTTFDKPAIVDAARRKEKEVAQKEIEKLRGSIQNLVRSAHPLGKIMDYLQEDIDSMQKEIETWKKENRTHSTALKAEQSITETEIMPLQTHLNEIELEIDEMMDKISTSKSNILRNEDKIGQLVESITR